VTGALPQSVMVGPGSEGRVSGQIWQKLISIRCVWTVRLGGLLNHFPIQRHSKPGCCATFVSAANRDKMTYMTASTYVKALDDIQKALTGFLKPLGFKRKGRTYNRQVSDGLVQAVNLQMGQFPIGDYVIPGLRESHYGRFTVNLGVALPAVCASERGREFPCSFKSTNATFANDSLGWPSTRTHGLT
jgi:hypothetical protein